MESAQPLNGNYRSSFQEGDGFLDGGVAGYGETVTVVEKDARPAVPTGIGLGMKATVCGILIFFVTGRTHLDLLHGGHGPIIGYICDDGVTRTAVGAINERISESPILRSSQLSETIGADAHIR